MSNAPRPCVRVIPGPASVRSLCLAVASLALAVTTSTAAPWRATGVAVDSAATGQTTLRAVADGRGGLIAAWVDTLSGSLDLRCQRIDSTGTTQWTANGVLVRSNAAGISGLAVAPDGSNGILLAWTDRATPTQTRIRVQRLNGSGAAQWAPDGVLVSTLGPDTLQVTPSIAADGSGGALVAWAEQRTVGNSDVYVQRFQSDATPGWTAGGVRMAVSVPVDLEPQQNPQVISDGAGGAYVSWENDGGSSNLDTYFNRLDASGSALWVAPALPFTSQSVAARMALQAGTGSLVIAWSSTTRLRGAVLAAANGTATDANNQFIQTSMTAFGLVPKSNGEALLGYTDGTGQLHVVRLDTSGFVTVPTDSIALRPLDATSNPTLVTDGADGAYAVWATGGLVRAQHLSSNAARLWASPATLTAGASPVQSYPAAAGGAFDLVAAWIDGRNAAGATGPDVYAQRVSPSGVAGAYYRVLSTVAQGSGNLGSAEGRTWVVAGDSLRVRLTSSGGSHIDHVVVGATNLGPVPNYTFHAVKGDSTLQAYFATGGINLQVSAPAGAYRAFSVPGTFANALVSNVFANLMPYDPVRWRLGYWSASDSSYVEPSNTLTSVLPGRGYWFIGLKDTTLSFTLQAQAESQFDLAMSGGPVSHQGWTPFGLPFRFPLAVSQLRLSVGGNVPITDASNTFTDHQVLEWNPGTQSYSAVSVLLPGHAYWLYRLSNANLSLQFPFEWNPVATSGLAPASLTGGDWSLGVTARSGDREADVVLGAAPVAAGRWNGLSTHAAPGAPGEGVSLVARVSDWGGDNGVYRSVYRPDAAVVAWDLDAGTAGGLTQAELSFDLADLPSGRHVVLSEPSAGWSREVSAGENVPLALSSSPRRLRLEVVAGSGVVPVTPPATALRAAGPNPFRDATTMSFSLAHAGPLRWEVFDLAGRRVVSDTRTLGAGEHVVTWDGRDASGRRVEPGLYLVRWQADGRSGSARLVRTE